MAILLIALIPAILVWVVGNASRSFGWTVAAAVIAAGIGLLSGNPAYALVDIFFVAGALVVTVKTVRFKRPGDDVTEQKATWGNRNPRHIIYGPSTTDTIDQNGIGPTHTVSQPKPNVVNSPSSPVHVQPTAPNVKLAPARWVSLDPKKERRRAIIKDVINLVISAVLVFLVFTAALMYLASKFPK